MDGNLLGGRRIGYTAGVSLKNAALLIAYLVFVTGANLLLKLAADAGSGWPMIALLVSGNVAGFGGILAYTGLLRTLPLHVAFPLSRGLVVLGVLGTSLFFFREHLRVTEAAGVALVTAGIILVGRSPAARAAPAAEEKQRC